MVVIAIPLFTVYQNKRVAQEALQKQQARELAVKADNENFLARYDRQKALQDEEREINSMIEAIKKAESKEPPRITGKETEEEIYNNPYIKHIRTAFNGYLDGSNTGTEKAFRTMTLDSPGQEKCGLDSFDKSYYKSKFFLYDASDSDYGGVQAYIVFKDKPDTLFWAWVYRLGGGGYSLRGFCKAGPPDELKEEFLQTMEGYIKRGEIKFSL